MRKFTLTNGVTSKSLDNSNGIFINNPTGLGYGNSNTYANVGSGFFATTAKNQSQGSISGEFVINASNPYQKYFDLIDFIESADDLMLTYQPRTGGTVFSRRVKVGQITKTELKTPFLMVCPFMFYTVSPWFTKTTITLASVSSLSRTISLSNQLGGNFKLKADLVNAGDFELSVTEAGATTKIYKNVSSIPAGSTIEINNMEGETPVVITSSGVIDRFNIDVAESNIPHMSGTSGQYVISSAQALQNVVIDSYQYWRSV